MIAIIEDIFPGTLEDKFFKVTFKCTESEIKRVQNRVSQRKKTNSMIMLSIHAQLIQMGAESSIVVKPGLGLWNWIKFTWVLVLFSYDLGRGRGSDYIE